MQTVTIERTKFETLRRRADLYERFLQRLPERRWAIEEYSPARVKEFMQEDMLDRATRVRLQKLLRSR